MKQKWNTTETAVYHTKTTKHTQASHTLEMLHITVMIGILSAKITVIKCVYLFLTQIIIYNERCK